MGNSQSSTTKVSRVVVQNQGNSQELDLVPLAQRKQTFVVRNQATSELVGMHIRFQLRDNPEWFVNWLNTRLRQDEERLWPGNCDGQYISLYPDPIKSRTENSFEFTTIGFLNNYSGGEPLLLDFVPLRFEVERGVGDGTLVVVSVRNFTSLAEELLRELMLDILAGWPEAASLMEIKRLIIHPMVDDNTAARWTNVVESLGAKLRGHEGQKIGTGEAMVDKTQPDAVAVADQTEPSFERTARVPTSMRHLQRWKATWKCVKGEWGKGKDYKTICKWLSPVHPDLACSPEILRDIIKAGETGKLDN